MSKVVTIHISKIDGSEISGSAATLIQQLADLNGGQLSVVALDDQGPIND